MKTDKLSDRYKKRMSIDPGEVKIKDKQIMLNLQFL